MPTCLVHFVRGESQGTFFLESQSDFWSPEKKKKQKQTDPQGEEKWEKQHKYVLVNVWIRFFQEAERWRSTQQSIYMWINS